MPETRDHPMLLAPHEAELFFKLHRSLMCFVNAQLHVVPDVSTPDEFSALPPETRLQVREAFRQQPQLLEEFVGANPFALTDVELAEVASWRLHVFGKFFVFRYLAKYAVFLATEKPTVAYGVLALTDPFEALVGPYLPVWVETMLLPFRGKIVHDGILSRYGISFGGGIRRMLNESYKSAKERLGIVTSLPIEARPLPAKTKRTARKPARSAPDDTRAVVELIIGMTDEFCREHLNEEYAAHCRALAEKLARKRPSPLQSGKPNTWACGIVRTIGWVNFLDDRSRTPHIKLTAIDKAFGVGESTGQGKSKQIRSLLKIRQFDPHWTLPSRVADNLLIWTLDVNGFPMDIRNCPREVQEIAFQKGLIPYIPADR